MKIVKNHLGPRPFVFNNYMGSRRKKPAGVQLQMGEETLEKPSCIRARAVIYQKEKNGITIGPMLTMHYDCYCTPRGCCNNDAAAAAQADHNHGHAAAAAPPPFIACNLSNHHDYYTHVKREREREKCILKADYSALMFCIRGRCVCVLYDDGGLW